MPQLEFNLWLDAPHPIYVCSLSCALELRYIETFNYPALYKNENFHGNTNEVCKTDNLSKVLSQFKGTVHPSATLTYQRLS